MSSAGAPSTPEERKEWRWALVLFVSLLALSMWLTSRGWDNGNLPGHEFRQTQTALSALFIQRENNFSPAYPTPILGAPWSAPMEFPLYQWMVVGLSNLTDLPLVQAGRAVSAFWLYVAVAALWPLLGRLGLSRPRRLTVMGLVLTCPLYVFYARGFLIETTELAFALWFLAAFTRYMAGDRLRWLPLVSALGVLAGLVKVTTFMVILIPAGWLTVLEMYRARSGGWWASLQAGLWGVAAILLPVLATVQWTFYADAVKSANLSAQFLRSGNMTTFNFGTAENRFAAETLAGHWRNLTQSIASPLLLLTGLALALTVARSRWRPILFCVVCYALPLVIFPTLYAWHDYYSVANAVLLLVGLGLAVSALFDGRRPWIAWLVILALHFSQLWIYRTNYLPMQMAVSPGGSDMTKAVRLMSNPDESIIVAGFDWDSAVAFYSQRKALMIRMGMERDWFYLHDAFKAQRGQNFTIFIGRGNHREDSDLIRLLGEYFQIDPRPLFRWQDTTVYVRTDRRGVMADALRRHREQLQTVELDPSTANEDFVIVDREMRTDALLQVDQEIMSLFQPRPWKFYHQFGSGFAEEEGRKVLLVHPNSRLWFQEPKGAVVIRLECCLMANAYADSVPAPDRSDGVEFYIEREKTDGTRERLASLLLEPATKPGDRGFHVLEVPAWIGEGESVVIGNNAGPRGSMARDWAAISSIRIRPAN